MIISNGISLSLLIYNVDPLVIKAFEHFNMMLIKFAIFRCLELEGFGQLITEQISKAIHVIHFMFS